MNTTPILRATNIVKKLGGKTILNDVSLDVHKGDVKVVIGPSGAGKSTFLQCLNYLPVSYTHLERHYLLPRYLAWSSFQ